ncbi:hypothetical protein BD560DRAFT_489681 [Blakeslea trispora]|nr:hypothetical protein BD560DRAFT_489681 [Blakeslea trispora]
MSINAKKNSHFENRMKFNSFALLFITSFLLFAVNSVYIGKRDEEQSAEFDLLEIRPGVLLRIETEVEEHTVFSSIEMVVTEYSAQIETVVETQVVTVSEDNIVYKTLFDIVIQVTTVEPITELVTEYDYEYATEVAVFTETVTPTSEPASYSSSDVEK